MNYRTAKLAAVLSAFSIFIAGTCCVSAAEKPADLSAKSLTELDSMKIKNNLRLEELQKSIEKLKKQLESSTKTETSKKEYRDRLNEKITLQNQNLELVVRQINMLETEVQNTGDMIADIESEMSGYREEADETLKLYKQRIRAAYMSGNDNLASVLKGSTSFFDILTRSELVARVAQRDSELLDSLEGKLEKLSEFDDQLRFKNEIITANLDDAAVRRAELDSQIELLKSDFSEVQSELDKISGDKINFKKDYDAAAAAVEEKKKEQEKITEAIKKEQQRVKEEMERLEEQAKKEGRKPVNNTSFGGSRPSEQINVPVSSDSMLWPVPGYTSHSSFYGYREFDNSDHKAIDIQGNPGDTIEFAKIYAAESGKVVTATNYCTHYQGKNYSCGCGGGYGNYIVLQHSDGVYQTVYAHCYTIYVSEGDYVRKGQLIGLVGSTGYSTGPHLHFEVRKDGVKTNPDSYTYINYG